MDESEKTAQNSKNEAIFARLAVWIAMGIVLGLAFYGGYLLLNPSVPDNGNNGTIIPNGNDTVPMPSKINITLIGVDECSACNSPDFIIVEVKSLAPQYNFEIENIKTIDSDSADAKSMIAKYAITKLPTIILSGETSPLNGFESLWLNIGSIEADGAMVYREVYPPYLDVSSGFLMGVVEVTEINTDCGECFDVTTFVDYLESDSVAMVFSKRDELDFNSSEAQALISKYNITRLPTFVLSGNASVYPIVSQAWASYGSTEADGAYVWRNFLPPYVGLDKNGSVEGLVDMIELVDSNCTECYNVSLHEQGLSADPFNLIFGNIQRVEADSLAGQELIARYNISAYPTILLSEDALLYPGFNDTWEGMGSIEQDGMLVFRALGLLGVEYVNATQAGTSANNTS